MMVVNESRVDQIYVEVMVSMWVVEKHSGVGISWYQVYSREVWTPH